MENLKGTVYVVRVRVRKEVGNCSVVHCHRGDKINVIYVVVTVML